MKTALLLFLFSLSASAQVELVTVYKQQGHLGFAAYWTYPTNGVWIAEYSTNLVHWAQCGNETILPDRRCYTETGSIGPHFYVRLRKIQ